VCNASWRSRRHRFLERNATIFLVVASAAPLIAFLKPLRRYLPLVAPRFPRYYPVGWHHSFGRHARSLHETPRAVPIDLQSCQPAPSNSSSLVTVFQLRLVIAPRTGSFSSAAASGLRPWPLGCQV